MCSCKYQIISIFQMNNNEDGNDSMMMYNTHNANNNHGMNKGIAQDQPSSSSTYYNNQNNNMMMRNNIECNSHYAAELAREKVAECLTLERVSKTKLNNITFCQICMFTDYFSFF